MKGYSFGELVKLAEAALPKTDNAVSATKLQTARTIGGVAFDGTGNINLPGVNIAGTQNTSGRAAVASTADKLTTARNINGVAFDGTKNIDISAGAVGTYTKAEIDAKDNLKLDKTGGTVTGDLALTQTGPTPLRLTRTSGDNLNIQFTTGGNSFFFGLGVDGVFRVGNTNNLISTGNKVFHEGLPPTAAQVGLGNVNNTADSVKNVLSATKLTTARTIAGVSFDGTSNISISAANVGAAPTSHTHTIANVTDLQNQLNYAQGLNVGASSADPNTTADHVILTNHANSPDASRYWHVTTTFYSSKTSGANRAQIAIIYNASGGVCRMYTRSYYSSTEWTPWAKVYTDKDKPTASDVGALAVGAKAADSDLLDGLDSTAFVRYGGGSYSQLLGKNASTSDWLRTTSNGLLPDANNTGSLGTSSWKFAQIHGVTMYENGTSLASKYLGISANAASASKLATPRAINGVNFDGSAAITITAAANGGTSAACSGNAATATRLATARTIAGVSFDGTANISISAGNVGTYTKAEIDSKDNTKLNLSGGTLTNHLAIKASSSSFQGLNIENTAAGWSYLQLKATTGTAHIAVNTNAVDGGTAGALHLRPAGQKNGSLIIQNNAAMRHQTATGYWEVGSQNASHCHYNTDRPNHWFNKEVKVNGEIYCGTSYAQRVYHQGFKPTAADVYAMANNCGTVTSHDWNTLLTSGSYAVSNSTGANKPSAYGYGSLFVQNNGTTIMQMYVTDQGDMITRSKFSTNAWNHWKRVYNETSKPTAADVGALPSGGTAAAATKLATPRAINGVNFDGSANITITAAANGGNAATATTLQTARTINGVSFNGSANITITAAANGGTSAACSGNAATATTLQTARTIGGVSFNGSANIVPTDINPATSTSTGMFNLAWFSGTRIYHTNSKMQVRPSDGYLTAGSISTGSGTITCGNLNASGVVSSNSFRGDGSSLTNLSMSQLGVSLVTLFSVSGGQTSGNFTLSEPYSNYKQLLIISSPDDNAYRISKNMWSAEIDVLQATGVRYHLIDDLNNHWSGRFNDDKRTFVTANQNSRIHAVYGYR